MICSWLIEHFQWRNPLRLQNNAMPNIWQEINAMKSLMKYFIPNTSIKLIFFILGNKLSKWISNIYLIYYTLSATCVNVFNIGDSTLPSTEKVESTFITSANEHTVQNQATSDGKPVINMFTFKVNRYGVDYLIKKLIKLQLLWVFTVIDYKLITSNFRCNGLH